MPAVLAELLMLALGAAYVVGQRTWSLLGWEAVTIVYLLWGGARVWSGERSPMRPSTARGLRQWAWLSPLLSSAVGATAAVVALAAKDDVDRDLASLTLAGVASVGVVLSWMMLQVGFAQVYHLVDAANPDEVGIELPSSDGGSPSALDYLYFAFTMGTSFATSDASVRTTEVRRVALVHSVVAFFYNAVVVAVAFQVLQQVLG
ncbi:DUF1345 domain-containing protein [Nocardioides sp. QY071]|uniref:DUF1345 domain-containing protein n=1 Tax=Nocardioides sp. QY071 TaxID=3044187 RepID=UPI00249C12F5|nr:DUF1345 domain-containing protein [Nocardioides sp. QY071]WGY02897.1 DUF1345 domain-containing protein [Nocardioides sp. QY071]